MNVISIKVWEQAHIHTHFHIALCICKHRLLLATFVNVTHRTPRRFAFVNAATLAAAAAVTFQISQSIEDDAVKRRASATTATDKERKTQKKLEKCSV